MSGRLSIFVVLVLIMACGKCSLYQSVKNIKSQCSSILAVAIEPRENSRIAIGCLNGYIFIYSQQGNQTNRLPLHKSKIIYIGWQKDYLITVQKQGNVAQWDSNNLKFVRNLSILSPLDVVSSSKKLAINFGSEVKFYDIQTLKEESKFSVDEATIKCMVISKFNEGKQIFIYTNRSVIFVKQMDTAQYKFFETEGETCKNMDASLNQDRILLNFGSTVEFWKTSGFIEKFSLSESLEKLYFSTKDQQTVSIRDKSIKIYNSDVSEITQKIDEDCKINDISINGDFFVSINSCGNFSLYKSKSDDDDSWSPIQILLAGCCGFGACIVSCCAGICFKYKKSNALQQKLLRQQQSQKQQKQEQNIMNDSIVVTEFSGLKKDQSQSRISFAKNTDNIQEGNSQQK